MSLKPVGKQKLGHYWFSSEEDDGPLSLSQKFIRILNISYSSSSSDDDQPNDAAAANSAIEVGPTATLTDETTDSERDVDISTDEETRTSSSATPTTWPAPILVPTSTRMVPRNPERPAQTSDETVPPPAVEHVLTYGVMPSYDEWVDSMGIGSRESPILYLLLS
ncbi:hypothetical protein BIW11_02285 [Tropilaelaps mercedesae]|uniref:Uncharacterized protein n=1 Tax=Tropilaelaps mercedesae TaxID=418985 RepID=A0A1V9X009_9ACAR|nr:hypothetical protein BIW11_02285 [Tropilaelaps mercedesae]